MFQIIYGLRKQAYEYLGFVNRGGDIPQSYIGHPRFSACAFNLGSGLTHTGYPTCSSNFTSVMLSV